MTDPTRPYDQSPDPLAGESTTTSYGGRAPDEVPPPLTGAGTGTYTDTAGTVETTTTGTSGESGGGREWVGQLQSMIDNLATQAAPVLREIGAKAAELAAAAGEKAGPIAHKAAGATEAAGHKLAERGREVASDLRRGDTSTGQGAAAGDVPNTIEPGTGTTSSSTYPDDTSRIVGE